MALQVGAAAPNFTLPSHAGENVTLSSYRGNKYVVLSIHVLTFTGG